MKPLELDYTLSFVREIAGVRRFGDHQNTGRLQKVSLSAGALHPIEILVVAGPSVTEPILYSDADDAFGTIPIENFTGLEAEAAEMANIVPGAQGHLLLFVGDIGHVAQAYQNPESLLWRDAGALLQTSALLASACGFSLVPLGALGTGLLSTLCAPSVDYRALGVAIIGIPQADENRAL